MDSDLTSVLTLVDLLNLLTSCFLSVETTTSMRYILRDIGTPTSNFCGTGSSSSSHHQLCCGFCSHSFIIASAQDLFLSWVPLVHQEISVKLRDDSEFVGKLVVVDPVSANIVLDLQRANNEKESFDHQVIFIPSHSITSLTPSKY
jgi:small nuclear ribonucleoprotein (snRNP)-like protein